MVWLVLVFSLASVWPLLMRFFEGSVRVYVRFQVETLNNEEKSCKGLTESCWIEDEKVVRSGNE